MLVLKKLNIIFLITLLLFLSHIILVNRILRKKEDIKSIQEKLSFSSKKRINGRNYK